MAETRHITLETIHRRKEGSVFPVEVSSVFVECGNAKYINGFASDITERKAAAAALSKSEERYRAIVNQAADGIFLMDPHGKIVEANPSFARMHGYTVEELLAIGLEGIDVEGTDPVPERVQRILRGETLSFEVEHRRKDGSRLPLEVTATVVEYGGNRSIIAFHRDLTERRFAEAERVRLEAQLAQAQKMESVGRLAGGVAHDFNNLLSVILNNAELAAERLQPSDPAMAHIQELTRASERAASLTRQLLALSRKQVLQPVRLNLNKLVAEPETMLQRLLGEDIEIVESLAPDLGAVCVDPGQMAQILLNLAVNARDSMPNGGSLKIETSNVEVTDDQDAETLALEMGAYVQLAVTDSGSGMDESTMARIFDPFFTTKEVGKGTGLGLSTVYGIVKQSGGGVLVQSEPGLGTTFRIHLPREISAAADTAIAVQQNASAVVGTETILVVEDEETLRSVVGKILRAAGYNVLLAANAVEALRASVEHAGPIHLLLTDVVMPGMNGRAVAEQLARARPEMKVVYVSGYTDDEVVRRGVREDGFHFLNKPVRSAELLRKLRAVLVEGPDLPAS